MPHLDTVRLMRQSPMSQALDAMKEKLFKTEDPFAAKVLNSWCRDHGGGELNVQIMDGESPIIFEPNPDNCPMIRIAAEPGSAYTPRGEGDKRLPYMFKLDGFVYSEDQRVGMDFQWLAANALFFPWMQWPDPINDVDYLQRYDMVGSLEAYPFEEDGVFFHWSMDIEFIFASDLIPFCRGI